MGARWGFRALSVAVVATLLHAFAFISAPASALTFEFPPTLNEVTREIGLSGTIRSVVVRTDMGHIVVAPSSTHKIRIHETWNYARSTVTHSLRAGVLTVIADCPRDNINFNKCSDDLTLFVPSAVTVDAKSQFGDVVTKSLKGAEKLATNFGDIVASKLSASSVSGTTDYGSVVFDLVSAPTKATGESNFGDVSMKVPAGVYDVTAATDFGDVSVKGITRDDDASRHLTATSDYGDVAISRR
jgi:hypothetical protein